MAEQVHDLSLDGTEPFCWEVAQRIHVFVGDDRNVFVIASDHEYGILELQDMLADQIVTMMIMR